MLSSARRSAISASSASLPTNPDGWSGRRVRRRVGVTSGGKLPGSPGIGELEDALGAAEALELVLAEVLERGAVRELVHDERGRGRRQQHLAAVARRT